jgi:Domain of unknown function (DUF4209)
VIWDVVPAAFDDADVHAAADAGLEIEREVGGKNGVLLTSLADAFKKRGNSQSGSAVGSLLLADGLACDLWLSDGDSRKRWGPLAPMREGFGAAPYPPPVATFPDALQPYFERRASTTARADLRARYHELIWLRWGRFDHAREAHQAYVDAATIADLADPTTANTALSYLVRAAELSLTLKLNVEATIAILRTQILRGLASDAAGYADWLAQRCASLIARHTDIARELIDALEIEAQREPVGRRLRERGLLEAAEALAREVGDGDRARSLLLAQAASFEAETIERKNEGGMIELALLGEAMTRYQNAGASADVQRLKPALAAATQRTDEGLHVMEVTGTIPKSEIENAASEMTKRLGEEERLALSAGDFLGLWPRPERVEEALNKAMARNPLQFLVSHTSVSSDGRYQPIPDAEPERRQALLTRQLADDTAFRLLLGELVIDELRHRGLWSADRLVKAVRLVDPLLADACAAGFEALEEGQGWTAAHTLIPQLERAVRFVAQAVGVTPMKRWKGGLRWASLEDNLGEADVEGALGAGLAASLRRLYLDPFGPNYRNEIAHGAADPRERQLEWARLTAFGILSVTLRLMNIRQTKPS